MDNGNKKEFGFELNTHSFTELEVEELLRILQLKFNLNCTIQPNRGHNRIYIRSNSMDVFRDLVRPYFHFSMTYKLL